MAHRQHPQSTNLLWSVEHDRRKAAWHLGVQSDLDPSLDLMREREEEEEQHTLAQQFTQETVEAVNLQFTNTLL